MDTGGHQHAVLEIDLMDLEKVEKAWRVAEDFVSSAPACLLASNSSFIAPDLLLETLFIAPCWCGGQGRWGTCPGCGPCCAVALP